MILITFSSFLKTSLVPFTLNGMTIHVSVLGGGAALPMCLPGTMHPISPINRMVSGLVEIYMYLEKNAVKMLRRMNG